MLHNPTLCSHVHFQSLWYLCVLINGIKNIFSEGARTSRQENMRAGYDVKGGAAVLRNKNSIHIQVFGLKQRYTEILQFLVETIVYIRFACCCFFFFFSSLLAFRSSPNYTATFCSFQAIDCRVSALNSMQMQTTNAIAYVAFYRTYLCMFITVYYYYY